MHRLISIIVYAKDEEEALGIGKSTLESLCDDYQYFDNGSTFDEDYGAAYWGVLPIAIRADSEQGRAHLETNMQYTKEEFMKSLKNIRLILSRNEDEAIWDGYGEAEDNLRWECHRLDPRSGYGIYVYNYDGEPIETEQDLANHLSKWKHVYQDEGKENPYADLDVWVVPADVQY